MSRSRRLRIAVRAWSTLGVFVLASIVMLPPALTPEADTPLAIDDATGYADVSKGLLEADATVPATPPTLPDALRAAGRAVGPSAPPGCILEIETALPTRAPPA